MTHQAVINGAGLQGVTRASLLLGIAASAALIGIRLATYPAYFNMPGSRTLVTEVAIVLAVYSVGVLIVTAATGPATQTALRIGTRFGVGIGALQMLHLLVENFANLRGATNTATTLSFMLATFSLWGVAGFLASRSTRSLRRAVAASCWSAAVTMIITATFGLALMYAGVPSLREVATWGEFARSGWTDVRAFAIANTLDAATSHLFIGPVVAVVVGIFGGLIGKSWVVYGTQGVPPR